MYEYVVLLDLRALFLLGNFYKPCSHNPCFSASAPNMEVVLDDLHYHHLLHKLSYCERINYSADGGNEA